MVIHGGCVYPWSDVVRMTLSFCGLPSKTHNPNLTMRKVWANQSWEIFYKISDQYPLELSRSSQTRKLWQIVTARRNPPGWLSGKESTCNAGDADSIPGSGRFSENRNDNQLRYSCLGNPMDREAWWATVCGVTRIGHDWATKQQVEEPKQTDT